MFTLKPKFNILIVFVFFLITGCASNISNDHNVKAKSDEKTMVVLNHIKFDKKKEFNDILFKEVMPAYYAYKDSNAEKNKLNDMAANSMRILLPSNMNEDSTWTFIMFADPFYEGALYNIGPPLNQKYGEEDANEIFARWSDCFASSQVIIPGISDSKIVKAKSGDKTLVVLNHIKSDKKEEFNSILFDEVMPAYYAYKDSSEEKNKLNDMAAKSMRILLPSNVNENSNWTFIMLADPFYEGALYNIIPPLKQKYGEEGAKEVFARWNNCFASGQILFAGEQK